MGTPGQSLRQAAARWGQGRAADGPAGADCRQVKLSPSQKRWLGFAIGLLCVVTALGQWSHHFRAGLRFTDWNGLLLAWLRAAAFAGVLFVLWNAALASLRFRRPSRDVSPAVADDVGGEPPSRFGFGYESALTEHDFASLIALSRATGLKPPRVIGLALDAYIDELDAEERARFEYYLAHTRLRRRAWQTAP